MEKEEHQITVVRVFDYKGRTCVVIGIWLNFIGNYHCGYVEVLPKNKGKKYEEGKFDKITAEEITYSGSLDHINSPELLGIKGKYFVGFDTAHYWNDLHPETKTFKSVFGRTKKLCDEMIKNGI